MKTAKVTAKWVKSASDTVTVQIFKATDGAGNVIENVNLSPTVELHSFNAVENIKVHVEIVAFDGKLNSDPLVGDLEIPPLNPPVAPTALDLSFEVVDQTA